MAKAAESALQLLSEGEGYRYSRDWLLEIAFHGNLVNLGTPAFDHGLSRLENEVEQHHTPSHSAEYVKGLLAYARKDFAMAERAFDALPDLLDEPPLSHQAGASAFRSPAFGDTLSSYEPVLGMKIVKPLGEPRGSAPLFLCAADELYFVAFAREFADQVIKVSDTARIHFHLVGSPDGLACASCDDLLAMDRVSLSLEQSPVSESGIYASMARFIVLPFLMSEWRGPVLVSDIDLSVENDPVRLDIEEPVALGFCHNRAAAYVPATAILAGHTFIQSSDAGYEFALVLSKYLHYMCASDRALWSVDQVALLAVWQMLKDLMPIHHLHRTPTYRYGPSPDRPNRKRIAREQLGKNLA